MSTSMEKLWNRKLSCSEQRAMHQGSREANRGLVFVKLVGDIGSQAQSADDQAVINVITGGDARETT